MAMRIPNGENAVIDIRKIEDYCLNPLHPRGRHKARVFRHALDLQRADASWLRDALLDAAASGDASEIATDRWGQPLADGYLAEATSETGYGKNGLDHAGR